MQIFSRFQGIGLGPKIPLGEEDGQRTAPQMWEKWFAKQPSRMKWTWHDGSFNLIKVSGLGGGKTNWFVLLCLAISLPGSEENQLPRYYPNDMPNNQTLLPKVAVFCSAYWGPVFTQGPRYDKVPVTSSAKCSSNVSFLFVPVQWESNECFPLRVSVCTTFPLLQIIHFAKVTYHGTICAHGCFLLSKQHTLPTQPRQE